MNRTEWIAHHGFNDLDMTLIDEALAFGGRITKINDKPLEYEILKYNKYQFTLVEFSVIQQMKGVNHMEDDKAVKVSKETYKILLDLKKKTGLPIKRIISNSVMECLFKTKKG